MTYYIYSEEHIDFIEELRSLSESENILFYPYHNYEDLHKLDYSSATHLVVTGKLSQIKDAIYIAYRNNITIGIVPLDFQVKLTKILDLPKGKKDAFSLAVTPADRSVDLFFCNDTIVLNDLRIGNTSLLKEYEYDYLDESFLLRLKHFWASWTTKAALKHYRFSVKTEKEDEKSFSAVGIIGLDYDNRSWMASALKPHLGSGDGKHMLAILSPLSLIQFYVIQPLAMFFTKKGTRKLPKSIGFFKSKETEIDCEEPLEVIIDDSVSMKTPVALRTEDHALALSVGDRFWERQSSIKSDRKSIRLDNIPKDEEQINYLSKGLPLFKHASKEQYAALFGALREEGVLSSTFMILLVLATMIATFGLFINSSSVIIGAMLLAPLMQPIVSLSMGVLRQDNSMQQNAAKTIAIGVIAVLLSSAMISFFIPIQSITLEMLGRLSPTILDLFVAIVSGVAAAYAKNNEKILGSLAGVSIAVALVPPIAVAGIGVGWSEWHMFYSAFLLFVTNLVGIVFAASMTFMILGYSPINIAKKGIITWFVVVGFVAVPLYNSFMQMEERAQIQKNITDISFWINGKKLELTHVEVLNRGDTPEVRCEVISSGILTDEDRVQLYNYIQKSISKEIDIIVTFRYRL